MQISSRPTGTGSGLLIEINQPKKLNALDLESFLELDRLLRDAAANPSVSFVAIWAPTDSNPKAFCAGGDVRRLYDEFKKSNDLGYGSSFFRSEYQVDQRVWKFPKPLLAFTHGITMGGGIGLIRGAPIRLICESSVWAMPEISIGLYPDVGATYFFKQLPPTWAAFMALTGARIGPKDLLELGLGTHCCLQEDLSVLVTDLDQIRVPAGASSKQILDLLLSPILQRQLTPNTRSWKQDWALIERLFGAITTSPMSAQELAHELLLAARQTSLRDDCSTELRQALETFIKGSSLSICLILEQLRQRLSLEEAFAWEYEASIGCMKEGDFFEGVRSRLVDKDFQSPGKPQWKYPSPEEIPKAALSRLLPAAKSR